MYVLQVLSVGKVNPPNVDYSYAFSVDTKYVYRYQEMWSECSHLCNGNYTLNFDKNNFFFCLKIVRTNLLHFAQWFILDNYTPFTHTLDLPLILLQFKKKIFLFYFLAFVLISSVTFSLCNEFVFYIFNEVQCPIGIKIDIKLGPN